MTPTAQPASTGQPPSTARSSTALPPLGTVQSRTEVLTAAGSRTRRAAVLRAAGGGPAVALAITRARNPDAPRRVVLDSRRAMATGAEMVRRRDPVPVWVREQPGEGWTFTGRWRPVAVEVDQADSETVDDGGAEAIDGDRGILCLEAVGDVLDAGA